MFSPRLRDLEVQRPTFIQAARIRTRRARPFGPLVDQKALPRTSGRFRGFPLVSAQFLEYSRVRSSDPSIEECGYS
jgi:hypothetical protein